LPGHPDFDARCAEAQKVRLVGPVVTNIKFDWAVPSNSQGSTEIEIAGES
jgi:hypothetical protein